MRGAGMDKQDIVSVFLPPAQRGLPSGLEVLRAGRGPGGVKTDTHHRLWRGEATMTTFL
jgi:hypothetical protein